MANTVITGATGDINTVVTPAQGVNTVLTGPQQGIVTVLSGSSSVVIQGSSIYIANRAPTAATANMETSGPIHQTITPNGFATSTAWQLPEIRGIWPQVVAAHHRFQAAPTTQP